MPPDPRKFSLALIDRALTTAWLYRAGQPEPYTVHHARIGPERVRIELGRERACPSLTLSTDPATVYRALDAVARRPYRQGVPRDPAAVVLALWWTDQPEGYLLTRSGARTVQVREDTQHTRAVDLLGQRHTAHDWTGPSLEAPLAWALTQHRQPAGV